MRATLRWTSVLLAGGLLVAPALALAQSTSQPPTTSPPASSTAVGPSELQNFSLPGTASKPADQPPPTNSSAAPTVAKSHAEPPVDTVQRPHRPQPPQKSATRTTTVRPLPAPTTEPVSPSLAQPHEVVPVPVAPAQTAPAAVVPAAPAPEQSLAPENKLSILPWVAVVLVLAGGALLLLWRRRQREALAGGAGSDIFAGPEPAPAPAPIPAPVAPRAIPAQAPNPARSLARKPAAPAGIVASRLRPAIEIDMQPIRCLIDDERVVIEFELELFNAGAAPARAVLPEARLINASEGQDQELAIFFANPVGEGDRVDLIAPMKRLSFTSQVVAPRSAIQEYEIAGRKSFVPLIAFNTLYSWSGGPAQTSAAYLVGRATKSDKLGPLRLDLGAREFRGLGAHVLPPEVRT